MRLISHTCSNTEIVCALGAADALIAVDSDSDHPPELIAPLPKLGRDLQLDVAALAALKPDLVLSSLTVPGHERIVAELKVRGLPVLICNPQSLEDVFADIRRIAQALDRPARGEQLVAQMQRDMPPHTPGEDAPRVLVEWWPKPVIGAARRSWVHDLIERAGGRNALGDCDAQSLSLGDAPEMPIDLIVMSWCGVKQEKYRPEIVLRRAHWQQVRAVQEQSVVPISEEFLGRPGPRLVEGCRHLRAAIAAASRSA